MSNASFIGMMLYLLLAIVGGFLSGLFSVYIYRSAKRDLPNWAAVLSSIVFYVAPIWAMFSLLKEDDLDIFYLLLIVAFVAGIIFYTKREVKDESNQRDPVDLD